MNKRIRKCLAPVSTVLTMAIMFSMSLGNVFAATLYENITYYQSEARAILDDLNDWRTSGDAWYYNSDGSRYDCGKLDAYTYDYNLEQIAMIRAVEISESFSHTRPDGSSCFTCTYDGTKSWGENIAYASFGDANTAYEMWWETNCDYSGQGHRRAMLSSGYTSIGIASVEVAGGRYTVMEFGYTNSGAAATEADNSSTSRTIEVDGSWSQSYFGAWEYTLSDGSWITGWIKDNGVFYYLWNSIMGTGWIQDGDNWYYCNSSGAMQTGWIKDGNTWYYLKPSGAMATGWKSINGVYYYFESSGAMASNRWIGNYYVDSTGAWTQSR